MHYYQFNIGDYRADTAHLSILEHGIYRQLIDWYYLDEKPIPKETQVVMRRLRLGSDELHFLTNVLSDFFVLTDLGYFHTRIEKELEHYRVQFAKNRVNGHLGGRPRKLIDKPIKTQVVLDNNHMATENNPSAPLTNNQEPITINHKPIKYIPPIPAELFTEYQAIRKSKRAAAFTERMFTAICNQAVMANITPEQAIILCCEKGWTTFNADWIKDKSVKPMKGYGFVSDDQFNDWLESKPAQERISNE